MDNPLSPDFEARMTTQRLLTPTVPAQPTPAELVTIINNLVAVLHPGVIGLIHTHHGETASSRACSTITQANALIARTRAIQASSQEPLKNRFTVTEHDGRFHVVGPYLKREDTPGTTDREQAQGLSDAMNSSDPKIAQAGITKYNCQADEQKTKEPRA